MYIATGYVRIVVLERGQNRVDVAPRQWLPASDHHHRRASGAELGEG